MLPELNAVAGAVDVAAQTVHAQQAIAVATGPKDRPKSEVPPGSDRVELNFSLSQGEKAAFSRLFSSRGEPGLSKTDLDLAQKAAERITKTFDEAVATKDVKTRERVEKAVSEWYSVLASGERASPFEFLDILRQVSMGNFDVKA